MLALLLASQAAPPAAADGPFRLTAREVVCRHEFGRFEPVCEVGLELRWEPTLTVVRVAQTRLSIAPLGNTFPGGKVAVSGGRHRTTVRAFGVRRAALALPPLDADFTVTAADRRLTFTLPDDRPQALDGVTAARGPVRTLGDIIEVRIDLEYPAGHPEFESFESFTAGNRCTLVKGDRTLDPGDDFDVSEAGRRATGRYRFPAAAVGDPDGWAVRYDCPGPLRERQARFTLKDIPLP
jgi:hypothetical protein